jgi:hypothetical protein
MTFRIIENDRVANNMRQLTLNLRNLISTTEIDCSEIKYILSVSLAYNVEELYLKKFLEFLYDSYPYSNKEAYQKYFNDNNLPKTIDNTNNTNEDKSELIKWIEKMFIEVFKDVPQTFLIIPANNEWGYFYWNFLYKISYSSDITNFIKNTLPFILPCYICKEHLLSYTNLVPITFPIANWLNVLRDEIKKNNVSEQSKIGELVKDNIRSEMKKDIKAINIDKHIQKRNSLFFNKGISTTGKRFAFVPSIQLPVGYIIQRTGCCRRRNQAV